MRALVVWSWAVLVLAAGCGSAPPPGQPLPPSGGQGTGTATTGGPQPSTSTSPPPPSSSSSPTGSARCGARRVVASVREQPEPQCLQVGASLRISAEPSPRQPWSLPASSDESVLRCAARLLPDGAAAATCTAMRHGTATVTTSTAPFAGDPHGPPQTQWHLVVNVV